MEPNTAAAGAEPSAGVSPVIAQLDTSVAMNGVKTETPVKTSLEKFEEQNPDVVAELKYLAKEELGRRVMFGKEHVGQLLPYADTLAVLVLDNGLIVSMQPISHSEPGTNPSSSEDDIVLPETFTRTELVDRLKRARNLSDDVLKVNLRAEFLSNNDYSSAEAALQKAIDRATEVRNTKLPKNVDTVAGMLASLHGGKVGPVDSISSFQSVPSPASQTPAGSVV